MNKWWDLANVVVNHKIWEFLDHVTNYQLLSVSAECS